MAEEKKTTKKAATKTTDTKKKTTKKTTTSASTKSVKKEVAKKAPAKKATTKSTAKKAPAKTAAKKEAPKKEKLDLTAAIKSASAKKKEEPVKKSLDDIIKHDAEQVKSDKPLDHVEVLRKKMEAQKKLNDEIKASEKDNELKKKLQALASANLEELEENADKEKEAIKEELSEEYNDQIKKLEEKIEKLNDDVKDRDEQIAVLTNSIISKSKEADLLKEIESLKQEIEQLKESKETVEEEKEAPVEETNKVDISSSEVQSIIAQGDILLRIKLLNERIAEKEAQIKVVEDELNSLTEKDIFATAFATEIKKIRDDRKDCVVNANKKLVTISKNVKNAEVELNEKIISRDKKKAEIEAFDEALKKKNLTYLEKEEELKIRAKMIAEHDSIAVKTDEARDNFIKQVKIYKMIIKEAEVFVENCNKQESELIDLYLRKLREERSSENKDYNESKKEREDMLQELNKLTAIYEEMKSQNIINDEEIPSVEEIDAMKKEYAKLMGKLEMIKSRYQERSEVEDVLRTVDPEVSEYLKAFSEKERLEFDNNEKNELLKDATLEMKEKLENIIEENNQKINELDKFIKDNEANEKVIFYKQLLNSMAELKDKEVIFKERAQKLKMEIDRIDFNLED